MFLKIAMQQLCLMVQHGTPLKKIKIFDNLSVLILPPASPELNPVEQIWQQLRGNWLANRCYDNYDAIVEACCHAWNWFVDLPGKIQQLCSRSWANL